MIYKMTLKDSADEMTFYLLEVPIVDKDIEGAVDNVTLDGNQYTDYLWLKKQFVQKWSILCDDEYTRLRGFYTRQFENADVPSYRLYYGDDIIRNSTLSGERIELSISGVADGTMSLTQMDGNATQTTYSGKNKVYLPSGTYTSNGITWTVTDGTIKANGTASSNWSTPMSFTTFPQPLPAGRYTFSIPSAIDKNFQLNLRDENEVTHDYNIIAQGTSVDFTTGFAATSFRFALRAETGTTINFTIPNQLQLEAGSSRTDFEPFVGGIPAPNPEFPQPISVVTGENAVKVVGKNLLQVLNTQRTINGVTFTPNADGSVTVDGTATYQISYPLNIDATTNYRTIHLPAGTYTISSNYPQSAGLGYFVQAQYGLVGEPSRYSVTQFTEDGEMTVGAYIRVNQGVTLDNVTFYPQLEFGNQATSHQAYTAQDYEINLGKNLFDCDIESGGLLSSTGQPASAGNRARTDDYITVEPNTPYTINASMTGTTTKIAVFMYKSDGTFISPSLNLANAPRTFTTTADTAKVKFAFANSDDSVFDYTDVKNAQLEKGTATPYAPYFTPIELAKIGTYQDRIYKDGGKWYVEKQVGKVVLDGSETWSQTGNGFAFFLDMAGVASFGVDAIPSIRSDYYTPDTYRAVAGSGTTYYGIATHTSGSRITIRNKDITTVADFKTWLSTHNTTVYYALATPTTTEITNEALVEELEALQDEAISVGQHNIYTDTPNALPTLTFDLTEYLSQSTTIIPETAVRLTLTDGGVINACGCRKDVQLTMRETIE